MPRYFFHIAGDDGDGTVLSDDGAACEAARQAFGSMIAEGTCGDQAIMQVVDASGRPVAILNFSAERLSD